MGFVEAFERISDNVAALMIVVAGIYLAVCKDFNKGYTLIGVGFGYLAGKGIPGVMRRKMVLGGE